MSYYIETGNGPHGPRKVVGGQGANGVPHVLYASREEAAEALVTLRRKLYLEPSFIDGRGGEMMVETDIRPLDHLRIPGSDVYLAMG